MTRQVVTLRTMPAFRIIGIFIFFLIVIHGFVNACWVYGGCGALTPFAMNYGYLFDLNRETNIPTWASTALILLNGILLWLVAVSERRMHNPSLGWSVLAWIFALLSMDEATDLHGLLASTHLMPPGIKEVGFSWVVPGLGIVLVLGAVYMRWMLELPVETRILFFAAGGLYVTGALGFEAIGAFLADETFLNVSYLMAATIEETLEFTGMMVMLYALLRYLDGLNIAFALATPDLRGALRGDRPG